MERKILPLVFPMLLAVLGAVVLLTSLTVPERRPALAAPAPIGDGALTPPSRPLRITGAPEVITVCLSGCPYNSLQAAVNAVAEGGLVKVAAGTYTGSGDPLLTISKTVTVRGGYTTTDWSTFDPVVNPTVLDGGNVRRVIRIVSGDPTVEGFHIRNGQATEGGGLYIVGGAPTVRRCRIFNNTATGDGGGLYIAGGTPQLENLLVYSNSAAGGGGVYIADGLATLWYSTLYGNQATSRGGGIYIAAGTPAITGTVIADNTGGGIYNDGVPILGYNDLWNNTGGNYSGLSAGTGDIQADPRFADAGAADFHLQSDSPCINAGAASYPPDDYDGYARPFGARADIGAHEFYTGTCFVRIDNGQVYTTVQAAVDAVPSAAVVKIAGLCTGVTAKTVGSAGSTVVSNTVYINRDLTLRGGYTITNWSDPDPVAYPTILDAQRQGRVIYIDGGDVLIEALHIRHGSSTVGDGHGGGIYVGRSGDIIIRDTQIYTNHAKETGGGVYLSSSSNTQIQNCTCYSNTAKNGGGIGLGSGTVTLERSRIHHNRATNRGAGIYLDVGQAVVRENTVYANTAGAEGGGLYGETNLGLTTVIRENLFFSNTATNGGGLCWGENRAVIEGNTIFANSGSGEGGGIGLQTTAGGVLVSGNTVYGNAGGNGGGIAVHTWGADPITVTANRIYSNTASGSGGGLYVNTSQVLRGTNNLVYGNIATGGGGGLYLSGGGPNIHLENNTFHANEATDSSTGGGLYLAGSTRITITNNIVVSNTAPSGGCGGIYGPITSTYGLVWGNSGWQYEGGAAGDSHSLSTDPQFVDPADYDFHIRATSPCRDAGDPNNYASDDYDGYARPFGARADIGAYEFYSGTCFARLSTGGRVYTTVQTAIYTAPVGGEVRVAGHCHESITVGHSLALRGGYTLTNWLVPSALTVLDGDHLTRVLNISTTEPVTVGEFIIQNGHTAGDGGGIYLSAAGNPRIQNVIFYNNSAQKGGGVAAVGGAPQLYHLTFVSNTAVISGGGLYFAAGAPTVRNSVVVSNAGGGIYGAAGSSPDLDYNDLWHNDGGDYGGTASAGSHSIALDPAFVDPAGGDYHLSAGSPCLHAADPADNLTLDFEGDYRPLGPAADLGADEVALYPDFLFTPDSSFAPGVAGVTVIHTHYLTNSGTLTDTIDLTYTLSVSRAARWEVDYDPSIRLLPGEMAVVRIALAVPNDIVSGTVATLHLTVTSRANHYFYATAKDVTIISRTQGIEIRPERQDGDINPGETLTYYHTIRNLGNYTDTFEITGTSDCGWAQVTLIPEQVTLGPQEEAELRALVEVAPTVPGGLVATTLVTATTADQSVRAVVTETTSVNHVPGDRFVAQTAVATDTLNNCLVGGLPCRTVSYALDQAVTGDTVRVAEGTYYEHDLLINKNVGLTGGYDPGFAAQDPLIYPTVLDAQGLGRVLYIFGSPTVEGFTLRNGTTNGSGGGIYISLGSPTLRRNVVVSNTAVGSGGGIYNEQGNPVVERNVLAHNFARRGGGFATGAGEPYFQNNFVYENQAEVAGGGVYVSGGSPRLWHNTFRDNEAEQGGGLHLQSGTPQVRNSIIVSNTASVTGGGIYSHTGGAVLDYNDVWHNVGGDYAGTAGGSHSISADPFFTTSITYYLHLRSDSPCVDIGEPLDLDDDFDGDPRPLAGPPGALPVPDLGADEYRRYGLEFAPDSAVVGVSGATVIHTHRVTNTGNYTASVSFACSGEWVACPSPISVGGDSAVELNVSVDIPKEAISGDLEISIITATLLGVNPPITRTVRETTTVERIYGVILMPTDEFLHYYPLPRNPAVFYHVITNTGNWTDTFSIVAVSAHGLDVVVSDPTVSIPPNTHTYVSVQVNWPGSVGSGCSNYVTDRTDVTATSMGDPSIPPAQDEAQDVIHVNICPNADLTPDGNVYGCPGGTAYFTHTLTHLYNNVAEIYDTHFVYGQLSESVWPIADEAEVFPDSVTLHDYGEEATINLAVPIPQEAVCGLQNRVWLGYAEWPSDPALPPYPVVTDTITVVPHPGAFFPDPEEGYPTPDEREFTLASNETHSVTLTYTHKLSNTGNCTFTFDLSGTNSLGRFGVQVSPPQVVLAMGEATTVTISVTVPATTPLCTNALTDTVVITAHPQGFSAGQGTGSVTDTVYVNRCAVDLYSPLDWLAAPGTTVSYTHNLKNIGAITDSYILLVTDSLTWSASVTPTAVYSLPPGGVVTVTAVVTVPPVSPSIPADTAHLLTVTARSTSVGSWDAVVDVTTVNAEAAATIGRIAPLGFGYADPGGVITYTHVLTNSGNYTMSYDLTTHSTFGYSEILTPTPPSVGPLAPGEAFTGVVVAVHIPDHAAAAAVEQTEVIALFEQQQAVAGDDTVVNYVAGTRYVSPGGTDEQNNCTSLAYDPCATIGQALAQALAGDEIHVAQGVYTEVHVTDGYTQVVYLDRSVVLKGGYTVANDWAVPDPMLYPTVLDAGGQCRVVYVAAGTAPVIEGFHIRHGQADEGAGIYVSTGATPTVRFNYIYTNSATDRGGGLFYDGEGAPDFSGNTVYDNRAYEGAGFYIGGGAARLWNNVVYENRVTGSGSGGGLYLDGGAAVWNNTFYGNRALSGGGVYINGGAPTISNTIFSDHTGYGVFAFSGSPSLDYNDFWHNDLDANVPTGTHSIKAEPGFIDEEAGNFYPDSSSPCIDAGDPRTTVGEDRDGNRRPLGTGYDIGAYEYGLALRKRSDRPTVVPPGTLLRYSVIISNTTTSDIENAVVTDTLHPYLEYVGPVVDDAVSGYGDYDSNDRTVTWEGTLGARKITRITFTVRVAERTAAGEVITNVAWVNYTATNEVQHVVSAKTGTRYVSPAGDDTANSCLDPNYPCRTVQYALDQALVGDEVLLAQGTYTATAGAVAVISKPLTLRGGYGDDWSYDPRTHSSVLDGRGVMPGVSIVGTVPVTLDSLHIAGGTVGVQAADGDLVVEKSWVYSSTGDGLVVGDGDYRLDNNVVAQNGGAGLRATGAGDGSLRHNTFADNGGNGVSVEGGTAHFTNTIFSNQAICVYGGSGTTVYLLRTLFDGCTTETGGGGSITVNFPVHGSPAFLNPTGMDYHLGAGSAALDSGVAAGVTDDVDNDLRPKGVGYDLGADELLIDVEVGKRASADVVNTFLPGTRLTYTLAATNTGYVAVNGVISDYLPAAVTPTGVLTWPVMLSVGDHWQQTLVVTVETGYAGTLTNVVRMATVEGATDAYTLTTLAQAPHLVLVKQADRSVAQAGQPLAYTIFITNTGNLVLHATVTDTPPAQLSLAPVLTWTPTVSPGETWQEAVNGTVEPGYGGLLTNVVRATTVEGAGGVYTVTLFSRYPALTATKEVTPGVVSPGDCLTYTVRVTNTGNVSLTVVVTDYLPAGVLPISGSRVLTWYVVLPAGDFWEREFIVTSNQSYSGTLVNQLVAVAEEGVSAAATAASTVLFDPGLAVSKQVEPEVAPPGGMVTYTLRVTNTGNVVLHVTVTDTLPAGVGGGTRRWTPTVGKGAVWTQAFTVTVNRSYSGTLVNRVEAVAAEGVSDSYTLSSAARYNPGLEVVKTATPDRLGPGDGLTYTIRITNTGNVSLTTVITDYLPAGVTPTGVLTWQTVIPVGRVWEQVFTVTASGEGEMENRAEVVAAEGARGSDAVSIISLESCRKPPTTVTIYPPNVEEFVTGTAYVFVATVSPSTATTPLSYTWRATEQGTVVHPVGGINDTASFIWMTPGVKWITVTAANECAFVVRSSTAITVAGPKPLPLHVTVKPPSVSEYVTGTAYAFTAAVTPVTATLPLSYTWRATEQDSVVHLVNGITDTAVFTWRAEGDKGITVTVAGLGYEDGEDSLVITVSEAVTAQRRVYLPLVLRNR